jgi:hypothetical protein
MNLVTPISIREAVARLAEQVESMPSLIQCITTSNGAYWSGTSLVCGDVNHSGFRLRSRQGPGFSVEVKGRFTPLPNGTRMELSIGRSLLARAYKWTRSSREEEQILEFLKETLNASIEEAEQVSGGNGGQRP